MERLADDELCDVLPRGSGRRRGRRLGCRSDRNDLGCVGLLADQAHRTRPLRIGHSRGSRAVADLLVTQVALLAGHCHTHVLRDVSRHGVGQVLDLVEARLERRAGVTFDAAGVYVHTRHHPRDRPPGDDHVARDDHVLARGAKARELRRHRVH